MHFLVFRRAGWRWRWWRCGDVCAMVCSLGIPLTWCCYMYFLLLHIFSCLSSFAEHFVPNIYCRPLEQTCTLAACMSLNIALLRCATATAVWHCSNLTKPITLPIFDWINQHIIQCCRDNIIVPFSFRTIFFCPCFVSDREKDRAREKKGTKPNNFIAKCKFFAIMCISSFEMFLSLHAAHTQQRQILTKYTNVRREEREKGNTHNRKCTKWS